MGSRNRPLLLSQRGRRRRPRLCGPLALALVVVAGLASVTAPATPLRALDFGFERAADACGDPLGAGGPRSWTCTFADDFDGGRLDPSKWSVATTAEIGFRIGPECYVDTPENVAVRDGALVLTALKTPEAQLCRNKLTGDYVTSYTGALVTTLGHFSQAFGKVEIRASFPDVTVPGVQSSLWLWPDKPTYGAWPISGEIDIAEFYTQHPDRVIPYLHYVNAPGDTTVTNNYCLVEDPHDFHTYGLEWAPGTLTVLYDGQPCLTHRVQSVLPLSSTAPFDKPFFLNLTQALGAGGNAFVPGSTPLPASTTIDYVRVWS